MLLREIDGGSEIVLVDAQDTPSTRAFNSLWTATPGHDLAIPFLHHTVYLPNACVSPRNNHHNSKQYPPKPHRIVHFFVCWAVSRLWRIRVKRCERDMVDGGFGRELELQSLHAESIHGGRRDH
jgi:hypothetical protein